MYVSGGGRSAGVQRILTPFLLLFAQLHIANAQCPPGFFDPNCTVAASLSKSTVCPGESFNFTWAIPRKSNLSTPSDVMGLFTPPGVEWPDVDRWNAWTLSELAAAPQMPARYDGTIELVLYRDDKPGRYLVKYLSQSPPPPGPQRGPQLTSANTIQISLDVNILPKTDPACAFPQVPACVVGQGVPQQVNGVWSCNCSTGFFGPLCESGCPPEVVLDAWGGTLFVSADKRPIFQDHTACNWHLRQTGVNRDRVRGWHFTFPKIEVPPLATTVLLINDSNRLTTQFTTGLNQTFFAPGPAADILFLSANPSWPFMLRGGWTVQYHATGCPAGWYLQENPQTLVLNCTVCPVQTFTNAEDVLRSCTACPGGTFQDNEGQTGCKRCAEYLYPEKWCGAREALLGTGARTALHALNAVVMLWCVGVATMVTVQAKAKVIYTASPTFLLAHLVGGMLLCVGNVFLLRDWKSEASCMAEVWIGNLGFELFLGALLMKSYRLHRIFNQKTLLRGFSISNAVLGKLLAVPIGLNLLVLLIWTADPAWRIPTSGYRECAYLYSAPQMGFMGVLAAMKVCMVAVCVYVTVKIWNIPSMYNESRFIGLSIYNNIIVGINVALPIALLNNASSTVICLSIGLSALVMITTGLMFVPKIKELYFPSENADGRLGIGLSSVKPDGKNLKIPSMSVSAPSYIPNTSENSDDGASLEEEIKRRTQTLQDLEKRVVEEKKIIKELRGQVAFRAQERFYRISSKDSA
ncbi:hypothetical protein HK104_009450 [Borealophlyctis nickersoniae]|nr:hypothetical protein HK104_009450 [Borealophlyctis nickersoniae]